MQKPHTTLKIFFQISHDRKYNLDFFRLILDSGCVIHRQIMPFAIWVARQENTKIAKSRSLAFVMLMTIATIKVGCDIGCDSIAI